MAGNHLFSLRALALMSLFAVAFHGPAGGADATRETYPRAAIDPSRGIAGADHADFGSTLQYWQDEKSLEQHKQWIGDPEHEWKLNWKFLDSTASTTSTRDTSLERGKAVQARANASRHTAPAREGKTDLKGLRDHPNYDPNQLYHDRRGPGELCAQTALWETFKQDRRNQSNLPLIKSLSPEPVRVTRSADIMEPIARREQIYPSRQVHLLLPSCHTSTGLLGQRFRGQVPTSPFGDAAHFPTYRTALGDIESLQQRFMRCNMQARTKALPPGNPAYTDLEVFYTVLSNDYPVSVPSAR